MQRRQWKVGKNIIERGSWIEEGTLEKWQKQSGWDNWSKKGRGKKEWTIKKEEKENEEKQRIINIPNAITSLCFKRLCRSCTFPMNYVHQLMLLSLSPPPLPLFSSPSPPPPSPLSSIFADVSIRKATYSIDRSKVDPSQRQPFFLPSHPIKKIIKGILVFQQGTGIRKRRSEARRRALSDRKEKKIFCPRRVKSSDLFGSHSYPFHNIFVWMKFSSNCLFFMATTRPFSYP